MKWIGAALAKAAGTVKVAAGYILAHPVVALIAIAVVGGAIAAAYFGFGFGKGGGIGVGISDSSAVTSTVEQQEPPEVPELEETKVIVIRITGNQVFVNDVETEDAETLKRLIENFVDDDKIVQIEEENAILATYEWVIRVLDELNVTYTQAAA